jgi:hypothetical protein
VIKPIYDWLGEMESGYLYQDSIKEKQE